MTKILDRIDHHPFRITLSREVTGSAPRINVRYLMNVWYGTYHIEKDRVLAGEAHFIPRALSVMNNILVYEEEPERFKSAYLIILENKWVIFDDLDNLQDYLHTEGMRPLPPLQAGNHYRYSADCIVICIKPEEEEE